MCIFLVNVEINFCEWLKNNFNKIRKRNILCINWFIVFWNNFYKKKKIVENNLIIKDIMIYKRYIS